MLYNVSKSVDPDTNLGALCDASDKVIKFSSIKGYEGWEVVSNLCGNRDSEMVAFGVQRRDEVVKSVAAAMDRGYAPHRVVESGPVQEVVWEGEEANLNRLPIAQHSELDGGRYIGSGIGIYVDPETGKHNTTWPRIMVGDGKNCPFMIFSPHVNRIAAKYARMGKPMPMAVSIGHHPAVDVAASISIHHPNCGELDYVESLIGEPFEFVKCGSINVDVPATAEIVIEGETGLNKVQAEGPFGNYLGTYTSGPMARDGVQKGPVFHVKRITMRRNPIYRHLQSTVWTEHQRLCMLPNEGVLFNAFSEMGLDVHDVYMPSWGGASTTIIQMTPRGPGEAQDALLKAALWENTTISFMSQLAIAVNQDVDIYDARDVLWAMACRTNWSHASTIIGGVRSSPLMPVAEKLAGVPYRLGAKALINATHLPPRTNADWWDVTRAWPQGKGKVRLADFVDDKLDGLPAEMRRLVSLEASLASKPPV